MGQRYESFEEALRRNENRLFTVQDANIGKGETKTGKELLVALDGNSILQKKCWGPFGIDHVETVSWVEEQPSPVATCLAYYKWEFPSLESALTCQLALCQEYKTEQERAEKLIEATPELTEDMIYVLGDCYQGKLLEENYQRFSKEIGEKVSQKTHGGFSFVRQFSAFEEGLANICLMSLSVRMSFLGLKLDDPRTQEAIAAIQRTPQQALDDLRENVEWFGETDQYQGAMFLGKATLENVVYRTSGGFIYGWRKTKKGWEFLLRHMPRKGTLITQLKDNRKWELSPAHYFSFGSLFLWERNGSCQETPHVLKS